MSKEFQGFIRVDADLFRDVLLVLEHGVGDRDTLKELADKLKLRSEEIVGTAVWCKTDAQEAADRLVETEGMTEDQKEAAVESCLEVFESDYANEVLSGELDERFDCAAARIAMPVRAAATGSRRTCAAVARDKETAEGKVLSDAKA